MCAQISDSTSSASNADAARLADEVRQATLSVVWRQWRALGASAAATSSEHEPLRSLIDPEALLLASLLFVEDERRLGDVLHSWASSHSAHMSVQRTKNLAAAYPASVQGKIASRLAWFAEVAHLTGKDHRWRKAQQDWSLRSADAGAAIDRPVVRGEGKARGARLRAREPAALLLRLRLVLGVSVKADALAYLISRPRSSATISEIADALGYTVAAVRRSLDDLVEARVIESDVENAIAHRAEYSAWAKLLQLPQEPLVWGYWVARFRWVADLTGWAKSAEARPLSEYAYAATLREIAVRNDGAFNSDLSISRGAEWNTLDGATAYVQAIREGVRRMLSSV